jgi:hypothetical protein
LIGEFYNSSLSVQLISREISDVDFYISSFSAPKGILELKLNFKDPSKISSGVVREYFFVIKCLGT